MDRSTYLALKDAEFFGTVDRDRLTKLWDRSSVPTVRERIESALGLPHQTDTFSWGMDVERFTRDFASPSTPPKSRLDEVVATFVLFLADQVSQAKIARTFVHHGAWESECSWEMLFRWVVYSVFSLLYDVRPWTPELSLQLDELSTDLIARGDTSALRRFARSAGVAFESSAPYPAETHSAKIVYHSTVVFGPYYWRTLHWMAEAIARPADEKRGDGSSESRSLAKKLWKQFATDVAHRTLRCGHCIHHYKTLMGTEGWKEKIDSAPDRDFPRLWYDLHNRVNVDSGKAEYPIESWEVDRAFMRAALDAAAEARHRK